MDEPPQEPYVFSKDARFTEIPEWAKDQLADIEPTGIMNGSTWHEVQFEMDGIMCQVAVVDRKYVALPPSEVAQLGYIIKVWQKEELS